MAILWLLNQSDGTHGINDTAAASGLDRKVLTEAAEALLRCGLLEEVVSGSGSRTPAPQAEEVNGQ